MFCMKNFITAPLKATQNIVTSNVRYISTFTPVLNFQASPILQAQPLRKKKKVDPAIEKLRNERKRKRLWRDIRKLIKTGTQLKPVDELQPRYVLIDDKESRTREKPALTAEAMNERVHVYKMWCIYKTKQYSKDLQMVDKMVMAQKKALKELRGESEFLYQEAIKMDENLLPFMRKGLTFTPPIEGYDCDDGMFVDKTRRWDPPPDLEKILKEGRKRENMKYNEEKRKQYELKRKKSGGLDED